MAKALVIKGADFSTNALGTVVFDGVHAESISLSDSALSFDAIGSTHTLTYTVVPSDAVDAVQWLTSNSNVATVTNGIVTVVGVGTCTITARCGTVSASCTVSVEVELEFGRYTKTQANSVNSTNRLTYFGTLQGTSNTSNDKYLCCCNGEQTNENLFINYEMTVVDSGTGFYRAMLPTEMTGGNLRVYNLLGYPLPIILPVNCTKIKCVCLSDDYAPYVLFFQSNVRASSTPGADTAARGYPCANRALSDPITTASLVYQEVGEFDVPVGYDSAVVTFVAQNGAALFTSLTESQIAEFKIYAV